MSTAKKNDESGRLDGQIERVVFRNEENGYAVLRVKVRGHKDLVTVVGTVSSANPGEWVAADGEWITDTHYGQQFKANAMRISQPDTLDGIKKFLGSGMIRGIGKEYAERLVQAFGRDVFNVIENSSAKLLKVEGIGPGRRASIRAAWNEQKGIREIMSFLFSHGVSTARAFRIHKTYGERAIELIQRDPYCLARDIHGIGFLIADSIALKLGIAKDSELRARAGIEYLLKELTTSGHCAAIRGDLQSRTVEVLNISAEQVAGAMEWLIQAKRLIQDEDRQGRALIYLPKLYFAEWSFAKKLIELSYGKHPCPPVDSEKALQWVQKKTNIELSDNQCDALRLAVQAKVMVITGGPGVGKTTLVNSIIQVFLAKKLTVSLCAPTGRAAKRLSETTGLEAKTIHRLLLFNPGTGGFRYNEENPLEGDIFIIDECSMIDQVLAYQLLQAIPQRSAVIFVGDADQLPSVGPGRVLRDIISASVVPVVALTEIFRQAAESRIVTGAHRINHGQLPEFPEEGDKSSDLYFIEAEEAQKAIQVICKMVGESIPQRLGFNPIEHVQILTPMQKGELGARNLNQVMQSLLNPQGREVERFGILFREGDRVMQTVNNYEKEVFNGDLGRITAIDEEQREIVVKIDDRKVKYEFRELDELVHAYAITIHKSQGSEYPCVIIPIHTQHFVMLQRSLLYTAVTRAKKFAVLIGTKKAMGLAVIHADSRERVTTLKERLQSQK
ncbi:MAG: ATP-dependent RecD-like DNA helicase [Kiritimatiellaceae bacterium]|nr:ATP-dependent RecD-like DNA helicase [Kiritimatiellaceae bacterium]